MSSPSRPGPLKGRGATYNPDNRFQPTHSTVEDDGWWQEALPERISTHRCGYLQATWLRYRSKASAL